MLFKTHAARIHGFLTAYAFNDLFSQFQSKKPFTLSKFTHFLVPTNLENLYNTRNGIKFCPWIFFNRQPVSCL